MTSAKIGDRIWELRPTVDFVTAVGLGQVAGWSSIEKFGTNPNVGTVFEDVWDAGGKYVPPTEPRIHNVNSTDALDAGSVLASGTADVESDTVLTDTSADFIAAGVAPNDRVLNDTCGCIGIVTDVTTTTITVAGRMREPGNGLVQYGFAVGDSYRVVTKASAGVTGASIIFVWGTGATGAEESEFVVLNGLTNVPTVGSYSHVFRMRAFGNGLRYDPILGGVGAVGTIKAVAVTDGTTSAQIIDGSNQTLMAVYTVPTDKVGYVVKWWGRLAKRQSDTVEFNLRAGFLEGFSWIQQNSTVQSGSPGVEYTFGAPRPIAGGADIFVEAAAEVGGIAVSAGFLVLLKDI